MVDPDACLSMPASRYSDTQPSSMLNTLSLMDASTTWPGTCRQGQAGRQAGVVQGTCSEGQAGAGRGSSGHLHLVSRSKHTD